MPTSLPQTEHLLSQPQVELLLSQPQIEPLPSHQKDTTLPLQPQKSLPFQQLEKHLPSQRSSFYELLTGGYKKEEKTPLDFDVSDLTQVNLAKGQECLFLEFGESSALAYLKPMYGEWSLEKSGQLNTAMVEAATFPALAHPPRLGQVVSAPRSFTNYVKFIRSEKKNKRAFGWTCMLHCGSGSMWVRILQISCKLFPPEMSVVDCYMIFILCLPKYKILPRE